MAMETAWHLPGFLPRLGKHSLGGMGNLEVTKHSWEVRTRHLLQLLHFSRYWAKSCVFSIIFMISNLFENIFLFEEILGAHKFQKSRPISNTVLGRDHCIWRHPNCHTYIMTTWYPKKHPLSNGCFSWMPRKHYI